MKTPNAPVSRKRPVPDVAPGQERPNENYREKAAVQTEVSPPNANAHIREDQQPKDQAAATEKNQRNPVAPKRGFERGDSRSQPDNFHPYAQGEGKNDASTPRR